MHVHFDPPQDTLADARHHAEAAAGNAQTAAEASGVLLNALSGESDIQRILLKAAAGAGKSYVLKKLVADAVNHPQCERVAVIAFQNRQLWPLAADLGAVLGRDQVCLFVSAKRYDDVPEDVHESAVVVTTTSAIPDDIRVVVSTSHKLGAIGELNRMQSHFGVGANGEQVFDALFVDEAWQLPHHLFDKVTRAAPIVVGVGHETDFTLADFAADVRAPTPSAAAELVAPDQAELRAQVMTLWTAQIIALADTLDAARWRVAEEERLLARLSPADQVRQTRERVGDLLARAGAALSHTVRLRHERLRGLIGRLDSVSPVATLERGYALVRHRQTGVLIRSVAQV